MAPHPYAEGVRRLLFIGAHPDDETFFAAGTFARYTSEGAVISVVCATRGESGKTGGFCSPEELPQVREGELRAAMSAVGVTDVQFLTYLDKQLAEAPVETLREQLVRAIRRTRPQVVVTFDPNGANQHPDHIAISRFASDAVAAAADPRWFPQTGASHVVDRVLWSPPVFLFRVPEERPLPNEPGFDFLIDTSAWLAQKTQAFEAHRTQFPGLRKLFFENPNGQRTLGVEAFRLGWGSRPGQLPATDLFADLL